MSEVNISFLDTTLRDGAQALPQEYQFRPEAKPKVAGHLARLGIDVIEAGIPFASNDSGRVKEVSDSVGQESILVDRWRDGEWVGRECRQPVIAGLTRILKKDIDKTWAELETAKRARMHLFVSTDDRHRRAKFRGVSREDLLDDAVEAVSYAKGISAIHQDASIEFSPEVATTTDPVYLEQTVRRAVRAGADVINAPDTAGEKSPFFMEGFYYDLIGWVMQENPDVTISAHTHDDLGLAAANAVALLFAANRYMQTNSLDQLLKIQIEGTVAGLGERAGNADLFSVVAQAFKFTPDLETSFSWSINPDLSLCVAQSVLSYAGSPDRHLMIPRQTPIIGQDTNVHRSGIHSDGVIKGGHELYTAHDPRFWGHQESARHEVGEYQGRAGARLARG